jgi:2-C-methyl-D-erythritol 4-phosphate cytidylyltransferase
VWVIVAAGESKQFLLLAGEPIICHSVRRLTAIDEVTGVVVVLHPSHVVRFAGLPVVADQSKPVLIAEGGRQRSDSVRAGLSAVPDEADVIAVHDGARPLFGRHVFLDCLAALDGADGADGAVPATAVVDTLKRADGDGRVLRTVDRRELWAVQTPQVFRAAALRARRERLDRRRRRARAGRRDRGGGALHSGQRQDHHARRPAAGRGPAFVGDRG